MKLIRNYGFAVVFLLALSACVHSGGRENQRSDLPPNTINAERPVTLAPLTIPNAPEGSVSERGVISVPVNRSKTAGQTIDVEFYRFKRLAEARPDTPPIFLLNGGPGYPGLGDAVENKAFYKKSIQRYTRLSDLIIVGQRGFGTSGDLACPELPPSDLKDTDTSVKSEARYRHASVVCRDKYLNEGKQLDGYNVKEMAADVAEIAKGLGYKRIQIKGNSFGSFWGIAVLRYYEDLVERATFAALEGPDHTFDRPGAIKTALSHIARDAAMSERYADRIPPEGLLAAYESVIERADKTPITTSFVDKLSGETVHLKIDGQALRRFLYGVTTRPLFRYTMYDWPDDLLKIIEGNFSEVAPRLAQYQTRTGADNAAEEIIECSSGISADRRAEINNDPAQTLVRTASLFDEKACAVWGDAVVDMNRSALKTSVPTVLIQGTWDISTPYEQARTVRNLFSDHQFVIIENGSHGAIHEAEESDTTFREALDLWYAVGDSSAIPEVVELPEMDWNGE